MRHITPRRPTVLKGPPLDGRPCKNTPQPKTILKIFLVACGAVYKKQKRPSAGRIEVSTPRLSVILKHTPSHLAYGV